jgi:hypothetical protein
MAWAQGTKDPIEAVRADALFETALLGYVNATNGAASLYFDAWSTAVDRFRDQLDKVKEKPSKTVLSAVLEDQVTGLVGKIPVIGGTLNTFGKAAIGDAKAKADAKNSRELGRFLQGVGTDSWNKRANQYLTSTSDERLKPVRETYLALRKVYIEALKAQEGGDKLAPTGPPAKGSQNKPGEKVSDPCPPGQSGEGVVQDLKAITESQVTQAERELLEFIQKISKTRHGKPDSELVDALELGMYASFYKQKGAIFVFDASKWPTFTIKTADVPPEVYKRVNTLIWRVDDAPLDPIPPWGRELFDIPLWQVLVKPPKRGAPLQVPMALHSLALPDGWSPQERKAWLKANPEYKRLAATDGMSTLQFSAAENRAFRDHVLFSKEVPK